LTFDVPPKKNEQRVGVILAGGTGSRLFPSTVVVNKQLLPVYDKPMIYYPLTTLMLAGVTEYVVVSQPEMLPLFQKLLANGAQWGIKINYAPQESPDGIAQAILVAERFIEGRKVALILGDNILYGSGLPFQLKKAAAQEIGATIFGYPVSRPEAFGVAEVSGASDEVISIEEKPSHPKGNLAIPGLYFYDEKALSLARSLKPSPRGELEITDLNKLYLERKELVLQRLGRGTAWLDGGTPNDLFEAGQFVKVMEERTGLKIACVEEVAFRMGFIDADQGKKLTAKMKGCDYKYYLENIYFDGSS
jgi:glucose-1-phosphate thymidylyltransferase